MPGELRFRGLFSVLHIVAGRLRPGYDARDVRIFALGEIVAGNTFSFALRTALGLVKLPLFARFLLATLVDRWSSLISQSSLLCRSLLDTNERQRICVPQLSRKCKRDGARIEY